MPYTVRTGSAILAGALCMLAGCGPKPGAPGVEVTPAPVVRGRERGLESHIWVVEASGSQLAALLRDRPAPSGAPFEQLARWRANGLRVLAIQASEVDTLRESLRTIGPVHRQWMGTLPEWVELVTGPEARGPVTLALDAGPLRLDPGSPRIMVRCWATPGFDPSAPSVLQVELMPEHAPLRAPRDGLDLAIEPHAAQREPAALAFTRLRLSIAAQTGEAIVILPENPGVDWSAPPSPRPESSLTPEARPFGPEIPGARTLGEYMLAAPPAPGARDTRIVIVLVPRHDGSFELIPG